jgi:hypothetical protein
MGISGGDKRGDGLENGKCQDSEPSARYGKSLVSEWAVE